MASVSCKVRVHFMCWPAAIEGLTTALQDARSSDSVPMTSATMKPDAAALPEPHAMNELIALPEDDTAGWNKLPDDLLGRVVALVDRRALSDLLIVEHRVRPLCETRLRSLAAPRLHELARDGKAERISELYHELNAPVLLLLDGRTILQTAIEARQLDLVQWLVQPLSSYNKYVPLSSSIISYTGRQLHGDTITPKPLPEELCKRLFDADGLEALRAAVASRAFDGQPDFELIDHLLPCPSSYPPASVLLSNPRRYCGRVSRELVVELRDALLDPLALLAYKLDAPDLTEADMAALQVAIDLWAEDGGMLQQATDTPLQAILAIAQAQQPDQIAALQANGLENWLPVLQAADENRLPELDRILATGRHRANVLDRRLRSSDIEHNFGASYNAEALEDLKAREEEAAAEGRSLFGWRYGLEPYTAHEDNQLCSALQTAIASDRIGEELRSRSPSTRVPRLAPSPTALLRCLHRDRCCRPGRVAD